jgi:hypothetical protein
MRISFVLFTVLVSVAVPPSLLSQVTQLDSQQRAAMQAQAEQQIRPAEFVLQHRTDLALTAPQVATLEALAVVQRDSARARQTRAVDRMRTSSTNPALAAAVSWSGPLDEAAVREALCQQSAFQVEIMLGLASDRRAVASVLTPVQVAQLPRIQTDDLMKVLKRQ